MYIFLAIGNDWLNYIQVSQQLQYLLWYTPETPPDPLWAGCKGCPNQ